MALRAHDHDSMPLCTACHHVRLGRMPKDGRREFEGNAVRFYREMWASRPRLAPQKEQEDMF